MSNTIGSNDNDVQDMRPHVNALALGSTLIKFRGHDLGWKNRCGHGEGESRAAGGAFGRGAGSGNSSATGTESGWGNGEGGNKFWIEEYEIFKV